MSELRFSIVIPTYNREQFIGKTIESVLAQTVEEYEIIVIDDGSTDGTSSVVQRYCESVALTYLKVENGERGRARNIGASMAKGSYVYFLDSDDILYPNHLEEALDLISNEDEPEIFWLPYETTDQSGHVLKSYLPKKGDVFERLVREGNFMSCHGVFIKTAVFNAHQFNEDRFLAGSEDMELWLRLAARYTIVQGDKVSSALIEHDSRSVMNFDNIEALVERKTRMVNYALTDNEVRVKISGRAGLLRSMASSYIALHCMMNRKTPAKVAWNYFLRSLKESPRTLFTRRSLAILKHGVKRMF